MATNLRFRDAEKENEIEQIRVTGSWVNPNFSVLKSVDFGISSLDNLFTDTRNENIYNAINPTAAEFDDSIFTRTSMAGFMDSFNTNFGTDYYFQIDTDAAVAAFIANAGTFNAGDVDTRETVAEELTTAFIQLNIESEINAMPLNVVVGLRYEDAETVSTSIYGSPEVLRWDMISGLQVVTGEAGDIPRSGEHDVILPSLSMALGLDENRVVRFSVGQSMARPSLQDLKSLYTFGNTAFLQATAFGGNPDLDPLLSTLSLIHI